LLQSQPVFYYANKHNLNVELLFIFVLLVISFYFLFDTNDFKHVTRKLHIFLTCVTKEEYSKCIWLMVVS